jgi:hypothetical protein
VARRGFEREEGGWEGEKEGEGKKGTRGIEGESGRGRRIRGMGRRGKRGKERERPRTMIQFLVSLSPLVFSSHRVHLGGAARCGWV